MSKSIFHVSTFLATALALTNAPISALAQTTEAPGAAEAKPATQGFLSILFSGGFVGIIIMLLLIAMSITALYLIFEQLMSLRSKELMPDGLSDQVRQALASGRLDEAERICRERPSLLSFVLRHGLAEIEGGWSEVEKALENALSEQSSRLFRRLDYLSVIANLATMLGLLGTVTGLIMAFQQVATSQGSAGAADLASGIYSALVTTVAGLVIAIPSLGALAILRNRLDELVAEAAYMALHVFGPLKRRKSKGASQGSPTPKPPPVEGGR